MLRKASPISTREAKEVVVPSVPHLVERAREYLRSAAASPAEANLLRELADAYAAAIDRIEEKPKTRTGDTSGRPDTDDLNRIRTLPGPAPFLSGADTSPSLIPDSAEVGEASSATSRKGFIQSSSLRLKTFLASLAG